MGDITKEFSLEKVSTKTYKFICKECSKETSHIIASAFTERGSEDCGSGHSVDWNSTSQIIQCQGCESVSFRIVSTNSEDYEYYKGLEFLIQNRVEDLGYDLSFSTEIREFGVTEVRDMIPNGRNIGKDELKGI